MAAARIAEAAQHLLDRSSLCALATVSPDGRAHINTAYFAWSTEMDLIWLSDPRATHSSNIRADATVAVAVYDSTQSWGRPDRGIQLFGSADEIEEAGGGYPEALYAARFPAFDRTAVRGYRFYVFRPHHVKLFDEYNLGVGLFVIAAVDDSGRLSWEATEVYRPDS